MIKTIKKVNIKIYIQIIEMKMIKIYKLYNKKQKVNYIIFQKLMIKTKKNMTI